MAAEVLYETFLQSSRVEILLNFCAKNPPHRQAEKRYGQPARTPKRDSASTEIEYRMMNFEVTTRGQSVG